MNLELLLNRAAYIVVLLQQLRDAGGRGTSVQLVRRNGRHMVGPFDQANRPKLLSRIIRLPSSSLFETVLYYINLSNSRMSE